MTSNTLQVCAEQTFKQMGLKFSRENVEQDSLLTLAVQNPLMAVRPADESIIYDFTEYYFYYEFMLYMFSSIELEAEFRFITKIKQLCGVDLGPQSFDSQAVLAEMNSYALLIPTTRMREVGIEPKLPREEYKVWYSRKFDALEQLQRQAVQGGIRAIPEHQNWQVGLSPRKSAYHRYLGPFADAMVDAVGGSEVFATSLEIAILAKRAFMFGEMQAILDDALARFGVRSS